jgi:hypothetical protein
MCLPELKTGMDMTGTGKFCKIYDVFYAWLLKFLLQLFTIFTVLLYDTLVSDLRTIFGSLSWPTAFKRLTSFVAMSM